MTEYAQGGIVPGTGDHEVMLGGDGPEWIIPLNHEAIQAAAANAHDMIQNRIDEDTARLLRAMVERVDDDQA